MSLASLYTKPSFLVRRLQQIAAGAFFAEVTDYDLTPVQYATLCGVNDCEGADIKQLAGIVMLDRSSMGATIERLAARGLIEGARSLKDKRAKTLRIAPAGRKLLTEVESFVVAAQARIFERITADEMQQFVGLLSTLVEAAYRSSIPETRPSLYSKPGYLIRILRQIADATFVEYSAEFSITPVQYAALVAINEHPGLDNTRLSYLVALDRATIGSVVKRLERKGWVVSLESKIDRRAKSLKATDAGHHLLTATRTHLSRAESRILAPLSKSEQRTFMRLLESLVSQSNNFSRAPQKWVDLNEVLA